MHTMISTSTLFLLVASLGLGACSDNSDPAQRDARARDAGEDSVTADSSQLDTGFDLSPGEANVADSLVADSLVADSLVADSLVAGYPRPISHWTFDDVDMDGATVKNAIAAAPMGTIIGATSGTAGQIGQGLSLDGDGDYVDFGDVLDGTLAGADRVFSIGFWIKPTALGSTAALLTKNGDSACEPKENQRMFHSALMTDGVFSFTYQTPTAGNPKLQKSGTALKAGSWHHVVVTYDGAQDSAPEARVTIFVDGKKETMASAALGAFPFDLTDGTAHLAFGARLSSAGKPCLADGAGYYSGALDDLAIWTGVLTQGEVTAIHARGLAGQAL